jgi:catechol 2,3-dioxygenase-like lactoylglutathione lyase family enzyme
MEDSMASADASSDTSKQTPGAGLVDVSLEVVTLSVSDVDRAKRFYQGLGWRLDADIAVDDDWRVVQLTPPGSDCSIQFGNGLTTAPPGSADRLFLVVTDIDAARDDLNRRGAGVSEAFHYDRRPGHTDETDTRVPGPDPEKPRSYNTYASFADPDGNGWLLQEITRRLPGREWTTDLDVASLADLLHETADHHARFEAVAPPHDWWDWYAAYLDARQRGSSSDEAAAIAGRYMAEVKHVVVQPA